MRFGSRFDEVLTLGWLCLWLAVLAILAVRERCVCILVLTWAIPAARVRCLDMSGPAVPLCQTRCQITVRLAVKLAARLAAKQHQILHAAREDGLLVCAPLLLLLDVLQHLLRMLLLLDRWCRL